MTLRATDTASRTEAFFSELEERGRQPLLKRSSGTIRFDVREGDRTAHWYVQVADGAAKVSRRSAKADVILRVDRDVLEGMVTGRVNAMAATLRGELVPEGDVALLMLFQRLFPSPPKPDAGGPGGH